MSVKYNCNHDLAIHIGSAAETAGIKFDNITVNYYRDEVTGAEGDVDGRTGGTFIVGDDDGEHIVMLHMSFENQFMPPDIFKANVVHRKIFRSTVRHVFKKFLTPSLQKFLIALYDELFALGWEVSVFSDTPNGIPAVQWFHAESNVGILPVPNTRTDFAQMVKDSAEGKLDTNHEEFVAHARSKI
jgi:hypothetical protein